MSAVREFIMTDNLISNFKLYLLKRRDAFEYRHSKKKEVNDLARKSLPNNLKYLDDMSQTMIRTLNTAKYPIRDKLLTAFVYRIIGDERLVRQCTNPDGIITVKEVKVVADRLRKKGTKIRCNYVSPVKSAFTTGMPRHEYFLAVCCDFIDKLPQDMFYGWSCNEICNYYSDVKVFGTGKFTNFHIATDFSFINELNIKIDLIRKVPVPIRKHYLRVTGRKRFSIDDYAEFVDDIMKWYIDQPFITPKERIITPNDVANMLIGWTLSESSTCPSRKATTLKKQLSSIVITRSMYDYWKENKALSHKAD